MIYLIGGPPRVGKSTLAKMVLEREKVAYIETDWLVWMLMSAAPQLHVASVSSFTVAEYQHKAQTFYPFLYQFIKHNQFTNTIYTIEGDSFFPEQVVQLQKEFAIKACFLGVSSMHPETILKYPETENWTHHISQEKLDQLSQCTVDLSNLMQQECLKYALPYVDLVKDREQKFEQAYKSLMQ